MAKTIIKLVTVGDNVSYQVFKGNNTTPERTFLVTDDFWEQDQEYFEKLSKVYERVKKYALNVLNDKDTQTQEITVFDSSKNNKL